MMIAQSFRLKKFFSTNLTTLPQGILTVRPEMTAQSFRVQKYGHHVAIGSFTPGMTKRHPCPGFLV
jgi:hypothetical protein